jgi:hypothetical protein
MLHKILQHIDSRQKQIGRCWNNSLPIFNKDFYFFGYRCIGIRVAK